MTEKTVYLVGGMRTPFLKARGKPGPFSAADLGVAAAQALLLRTNLSGAELDQVITGCVMPSSNEANIARVIGLRLNVGYQVPAWTVQRNCASGLQALATAANAIRFGGQDLILTGGTEAMSRAPLLCNEHYIRWLAQWSQSATLWQRVKQLGRLRPQFFAPVIALLQGLTDPVVGLSMGQTAENLAYRFGISREAMDEFALQSQLRAAAGYAQGHFAEILPIFDNHGHVYDQDDGVRPESNLEKLAQLKPFFDKPFGTVTPGNSSQITDGAVMVLLASKEAVLKYQLPVQGKILGTHWAGVDPAQMGLGPAHAVPPLLARFGLNPGDIDCWEINEAFAVQVMACIQAWQDKDYCRKELALPGAFGIVDVNKLNVDGGAIALGHPVGASGARLALHVAQMLARTEGRYGVATLCIGGGQGGAMLIERCTEVEDD